MTVDSILCREANISDYEAVTALYAELNPSDPVADESEGKLLLQDILRNKHLLLLVGLLDTRVVATCYLNVVPNLSRNLSPYAILENVVVTRSQQNRGYGQQIVQAALAIAWRQQCYKVMLQTGSARPSTHQFYERCGFRADQKFAFVARPI